LIPWPTVAKKPKTPPPPRKVQAPKQRHDAKTPDPERQKKILYGVAGAGVAGLIIALIIVFAGGGTTKDVGKDADKKVAAAMAAAGCTFKSVPPIPPRDGNSYHGDSPTPTTKVKWSTSPPSAGGHYGQYAIWGFYTQPVEPNRVVHNLEHGAVVIWWGPQVTPPVVSKLRDFYDESPNSMFGTPFPGLGNKVALTAWTGDPAKYNSRKSNGIGHIAICPGFGDKALAAFRTFRDVYRAHGPEGVPSDANNPGS
jgi:hypothetical protein